MLDIKLDYSMSRETVADIDSMKDRTIEAKNMLLSGTGKGSDYIGWVDLPVNMDSEELSRIKKAAEKIRNESDILVVVGVGGSYLGARAGIEFLVNEFDDVKVIFTGNTLSTDALASVIRRLEGRDWSINVISKSGTTLEPAIAFRVLKKELVKKYGDKASSRIYATTDKHKGALKTLADSQGYETFVVPDNVGGRFSVLSAVGLLPIAVSGADIDMLLAGARDMREACINNDFDDNMAMQYAAARHIMMNHDKSIEVLCTYEPATRTLGAWWKQLFGESEGKDHKGLFPVTLSYTTDLHSLGQYIQDGKRIMFETVLVVESSNDSIVIEEEKCNLDGLNYLSGKTLDFVNGCALEGTMNAHIEGDTPNIKLIFPKKDEYNLGCLFYFFEFACGISGYMLGVNPFNQPGVESYKKNMFRLLGRPGYEE
ncbi:MAG: glucose-6-phosphate isomerase [Lachnospiraceae bacterium]|nr:glucose-6-phosphate isomerase [Lachnospiraceae bacterium]